MARILTLLALAAAALVASACSGTLPHGRNGPWIDGGGPRGASGGGP